MVRGIDLAGRVTGLQFKPYRLLFSDYENYFCCARPNIKHSFGAQSDILSILLHKLDVQQIFGVL